MTHRQALLVLIAVLALFNAAIAFAAFTAHKSAFTVSFLDVGQGDAILLRDSSGATVLIDGGKDKSVLRELGGVLGPFERAIDIVIATHPDADHIGGLPEVFERYSVGAYLSTDAKGDTGQAHALLEAVASEKGVQDVPARRGMNVLLPSGAYLSILFPDREVAGVETNTGSIVLRAVYGDTSFFLSGDAPEGIENYVVSLDGDTLQSDVLKAGHHGSRTSTGEAFLDAVSPSIVVVSAGKDNSYGHPHEEVLERIREKGASLVATMGEGRITFVSDGETLHIRQ